MTFEAGISIWLIGFGICAVQGVFLYSTIDSKMTFRNDPLLFIVFHITSFLTLISICVIPISSFIANDIVNENYSNVENIYAKILFGAFFVLLWLFLGGVFKYFNKKSILVFAIIGILGIGIGADYGKYYIIQTNERESNIEYVTRKEAPKIHKDRKLIYFYGIPAGEVTDDNIKQLVINDGKFDEIPYWYLAKSNEIKPNKCPTEDAIIRRIDEDEEPHIQIVDIKEKKVKIDHNGEKDTEEILEESTKRKYIFYLHRSSLKHRLW